MNNVKHFTFYMCALTIPDCPLKLIQMIYFCPPMGPECRQIINFVIVLCQCRSKCTQKHKELIQKRNMLILVLLLCTDLPIGCIKIFIKRPKQNKEIIVIFTGFQYYIKANNFTSAMTPVVGGFEQFNNSLEMLVQGPR